jgi:uncharacterized membrane protein
MIAAIGDTTYRIVLLLHIASVVVAFAPAVVHPLMGAQYRARPPEERTAFARIVVRNGTRVYAPALVVVGLLGIVLVLLSDDVLSLGDPWITASMTIWIVMNGVVHAVLLPAERRLAAGDDSVDRIIAAASATVSLLLVVMLYLMVWQPGR